MQNPSIAQVPIKKLAGKVSTESDDTLAVEEPLEIRLAYWVNGTMVEKAISVTMRTPGNDAELATGFLFTEGIIKSYTEVKDVVTKAFDPNVIVVKLQEGINPDIARLERNFYTTSSCGVCGKTSIDAVKTVCQVYSNDSKISVSAATLYNLPEKLRKNQSVFDITGGLHASAIFDTGGSLVLTREDVGRHNALDKLIGAAILTGIIPLRMHILLLSGRASFELIQKASMAGIRIVAAVGAPSSLAAQLAAECGITLVGFLREERLNIYCGAERIVP